MSTTIWAYSLYIAISTVLTIYVGQTLHKRGRIFILESFHQNEGMTDSVNHLLLVGFYLINLGFVFLFLRIGTPPENVKEAFEYISTKEGIVLITLGIMHFFNMYNIAKMRKKSKQKKDQTNDYFMSDAKAL